MYCALARIPVSSPAALHSSSDVSSVFFLQEGDRTQLFDRATEQLLVRFPHCATVPTHLHLAHLRFAHKGHYTLLSWSKDVQLCGATHCTSC